MNPNVFYAEKAVELVLVFMKYCQLLNVASVISTGENDLILTNDRAVQRSPVFPRASHSRTTCFLNLYRSRKKLTVGLYNKPHFGLISDIKVRYNVELVTS